MNLIQTLLLPLLIFLCGGMLARAQLIVTVSPTKFIGQKAVVPLTMTNNLDEKIESARAAAFLVDGQGKMLGQSSKWVIGGTRERSALEPNAATKFNFVISSNHPFTGTNISVKIVFERIVLDGDKLADINRDVQIQSAVSKTTAYYSH
jgi:hypothetical protein